MELHRQSTEVVTGSRCHQNAAYLAFAVIMMHTAHHSLAPEGYRQQEDRGKVLPQA
jgi:hypothetical protein